MANHVQLFITCLVDTFTPAVGEAVTRVLTRLGLQVAFPARQTCCGQPAFNAGMRAQARQMAAHTICALESAPGPVVLPSGSCTSMIVHGYAELFAGDLDWLPRARALAERTHEFSQFLVDILGVSDVGARFSGCLAYHPSCHLLRELGVDRQPRVLLEAVEGAELVALPHADECCGFGGLFSVEYPEISSAMLARKIAAIQESGAQVVVTCDTGCLMHMGGGLAKEGRPQQVLHLAEVLASDSADHET